MLNLEDHSPKTLEEAVSLLDDSLTDPERADIHAKGAERYHFSAGMAIRNSWIHLHEEHKNTILTQHFIDRFGWLHADDISGLILENLTASVRGQAYDPAPSVARFKKHWLQNGINPDTGEEI